MQWVGFNAQRWQCQLVEQTRDQVFAFAQRDHGIFHLGEDSLLLGVKLKDVPADIGSYQQVLNKNMLSAQG
jgi:hypothetical protein